MDAETKRLSTMASQMDPDRRRDLQEVLANELQRRRDIAMNQANAGGKARMRAAGGLDRDALGDIYANMNRPVQELKVKQLEERLAEVRGMEQQMRRAGKKQAAEPWFANPFAGVSEVFKRVDTPKLMLLGLLLCGAVKIAYAASESSTVGDIRDEKLVKAVAVDDVKISDGMPLAPALAVSWSEGDKALLTKLDERRVELERRNSQLDQRERQMEDQAKIIAERVAELRSISNQLSEVRREKDSQQQKRLEQLANVYSSMAPNEAAELLSRIDDEIALGLLERMPGKRLGQILGLMKPDRAVALTKSLTDREKL